MNGAQIQFHGNMTRDPEQRYTANGGTPYTRFGVAVNTWRGEDQPEETIFFSVDAYGTRGSTVMNYAHKGDQVFVQGRYSFREYTRDDGSTGHVHQVMANEYRRFPRMAAVENAEQAGTATPEEAGNPGAGTTDLDFSESGEEDGESPFDGEENEDDNC